MKKKYNIVIGLLLAAGIVQPSAAEPVCADGEVAVPVAGKILSNGIQQGSTLGTVHLQLGPKTRLKCGILGQGGVAPDGAIQFVETVVCDDAVVATPDGQTVHSQISLSTSGVADVQACASPPYPAGSTSGTFQETSVPIPGTGRGIFQGVERGQLVVKGAINCLFSLEMKFAGAVCLKAEP